MSYALIVTTQDTGFEGEITALFNTPRGVYSILLDKEELCRGLLPIEVEERQGEALFIRLPSPTLDGKWCVWVPKAFVEELDFA